MRIISGKYRNRTLLPAKGRDIRPVMDRVKTFIFDVIGPSLEGARVLDLFAGTGSLGIEALSRGALHVDFVDIHPDAIALIRRNLERIGVGESYALCRSEARRFLARGAAAYDLVFCDPPYRYPHYPLVVKEILLGGAIAEGGLLVVEHPPGVDWDAAIPVRSREFGRTQISMFARPVN